MSTAEHRFGLPSILAAMAPDGRLPDTEEGLRRLMDQFNDLPFEERGRLLDAVGYGVVPLSPWDRLTRGIVLPPAAPNTAGAEDAAAAAPVLGSFARLREFFGAGRKLTAKGNPTVADTRELAVLLDDPGLALHQQFGGIRGADDLPDLQFLLRWAKAAGALRVRNGRMAATGSWSRLEPLAALARATEVLLAKGPMTLANSDRRWGTPALDSVLDEGVAHLLAVLWAVPEPFPYEDLLDAVTEVCDSMLHWSPQAAGWRRDRYRWSLDQLTGILARAGLVERDGGEVSLRPSGLEERLGGDLSLTAAGRAVLAGPLRAAGFDIGVAGEWSDRPLADLLDQLAVWAPNRTEVEFDCWVERQGADKAVEALADYLRPGYRDPQVPVAAVYLAGRLPAPFAEQAVRRLFDSPARGHAAGWLLEHGHGEVEIDEPAMLLAGVELLAMSAEDDPERFVDLLDGIDDLADFVAQCGTVPGDAAERVLRTIAAVHPDPAVATAARRAAMARGPVGGRSRPASGAYRPSHTGRPPGGHGRRPGRRRHR